MDAKKEKQNRIRELATKHNAVILAHYYVADEIQEVADFLGDSLYLAQQAQSTDADVILFCGVNFMAETAKILNPQKIVIVPDNTATCSLAECLDATDCIQWKQRFDNPYLISYINCATEVKTISDVICTSSNALKIVESAPKDATLLFAPDVNLGNWLNKTLGVNMQIWNGHCVVHHNYKLGKLMECMTLHPRAEVIAHPECPEEILQYADFVGSTTGIINYAKKGSCDAFIVLTEVGVLRTLQMNSPEKHFYTIHSNPPICVNMKRHSLDKAILALDTLSPQITMNEDIRLAAYKPLAKMLELSK
ncbi:MAG: quinolinate synthase NadA [Ignavibacteria bacterium]|jgi:quinolinate synthase|nr:quinolinate synthase NadA [Ignavibacteria bacterium]